LLPSFRRPLGQHPIAAGNIQGADFVWREFSGLVELGWGQPHWERTIVTLIEYSAPGTEQMTGTVRA
jgi:hypothetical protein